MEISIKGETKELVDFLQKMKLESQPTELNFDLVGTQRWESQKELIKKISAECSGNCNLRISAKTFAETIKEKMEKKINY